MKERGLALREPFIKALLCGRKTQLRVPVKKTKHPFGHMLCPDEVVNEVLGGTGAVTCHLGGVGDRIYVRESWCQQWDEGRGEIRDAYWYRASDPDVVHYESMERSPWISSTQMPKSVARIWLEISHVWIEQLQDISAEEAIAEGVEPFHKFSERGWRDYSEPRGREVFEALSPEESFRSLWNATGGSWEANPWVWGISFRVLSTNGRPT